MRRKVSDVVYRRFSKHLTWPWFNPRPSGCIGPHFDAILHDLFWAATSASFQVIPILDKSLLTVLLQFARGRPGPFLNPGTSQCNACWGIRWWSICITCPSGPSQQSLLSLSMSSMLCCPVLTLTSSVHLLHCPSRRYPRCSFAIYDGQRSAFSLVLLLVAISLHCTEGLIASYIMRYIYQGSRSHQLPWCLSL